MVNKGMEKGGREFREIGRAGGRMAECIIDAATGSAIATHVLVWWCAGAAVKMGFGAVNHN